MAAVGIGGVAGGVVAEGDTIIWDVNGDRRSFVVVDKKSDVKLGRAVCSAAPLIGCPYGAMFGLAADGRSLERVAYTPLSDWDRPAPAAARELEGRSNAGLLDAGGAAQGLSTEDIEAMKEGGAAGADIVAALTANSTTFATKTEFSQEKYKKKKAKKYIQIATVRRPTAAAVCEAYFASNPARIAYLRVDALALLLSQANVGAHARVLVVEGCGGMVTAAVAERLGGHGGVASSWPGGEGTRAPGLSAWRHLNLSPAQRAAMRFAPLRELLAEAAAPAQRRPAAQPAAAEQRQEGEGGGQAQAGAADGAGPERMDAQDAGGEAPEQQAAAAAGGGGGAPAAAGQQQAAAAQLRPPYGSCILALPTASPLALIRHVLPLLAPSASLAVFCPWQQPLAEALDALRGQGRAVGLALQEPWWREMQVLPLRTHPTMNMNHGGGFILAMTALAPPAGQPQ